MNIQQALPETISKYRTAVVLGLSTFEVMTLVTTKQIQSSSYEEIPVAGIAKFLGRERGYDQDYIEYFLYEMICQNL